MYKSFFKLNSEPFKLTPDTACFFAEGSRKAILEALIYSVRHGDGICKVTGEVGSGKTLLSRLLAKSLPDKFEVLYLLNPRISADKILYAIAVELGLKVDYAENKVRLLHFLHNKLLEFHQQNKQTVLLIDEAQTIPLETLEEIRMLGNLETGQDKLLQIVLFGQPELEQNLNKHEVRQIKERIIHSFYLPKLTVSEVGRYLYFRMQKAGFQGVFPFSSLAVRLIAMNSGGFLRRVNILADKCLLAAFSRQSKKVGLAVTLRVLFEGKSYSRLFFATVVTAGITALIYGGIKQQKIRQFFSLENAVVASNFLENNRANDIQEITEKTEKKQFDQQIISVKNNSEERGNIKNYTIQLLRVRIIENQSIRKILENMVPRALWPNVYFFAEKPQIYQVILGDYLTYAEAEKDMLNLPPTLRNNKPYVLKKDNKIKRYQPLKKKTLT